MKKLPYNFDLTNKNLPLPGIDSGESETVAAFMAALPGFAKEYLGSLMADEKKKIDRSLISKAGQFGLLGLSIPRQFGGLELSLKGCCSIIEELAQYESGFSTTVGLHNGLGIIPLLKFGSPYLKEKYLPLLATGEYLAAFSATEPQAGSHISNVKTSATYLSEKNQLKIQGSKIFVTNGALADVYTLLIRTPQFQDHHEGLSLVIIPRASVGLSIGKEENKMGIKCSSTTALYLDDVCIDTSHIIGQPGRALDYLETILSWGRTMMSAGCLGIAQNSYRLAQSHAGQRVQFGQTLNKHRLIQNKLLESAQGLLVMKSIVNNACHTEYHCGVFSFESALAKITCSEYATLVADHTIQVLGGTGFIEENKAPRNYRDLRITRIFEGANEMLRLHIAMHVVSWSQAYREELSSISALYDDSLREHLALFKTLSLVWLNTVRSAQKKYKFSMLKNEQLMAQISDSTSAFYNAKAVIAYLSEKLALRAPGQSIEPSLQVALDTGIILLYDLKKRAEVLNSDILNEEPYNVSMVSEALTQCQDTWL